MTGAGSASGATALGELRIELRAVNGRSFILKQRLCPEVSALEIHLEEEVRRVVTRGTVTLIADRIGSAVPADRAALKRLVVDLRALAAELGVADDLTLRDVLTLSDKASRATASPRELPDDVAAVLRAALADLQRHRFAEGAATVAAMREQLAELARLRDEAASRAPQLVAAYRDKLLQRVREFVQQQGVAIDAESVVREVAVFADRSDVAEELQRLLVHLAEIHDLLTQGGAVGRKLEFLLQEVLRETNTLGSKSPDAAVAHLVVAMKTCIDRLKEQAANLE